MTENCVKPCRKVLIGKNKSNQIFLGNRKKNQISSFEMKILN